MKHFGLLLSCAALSALAYPLSAQPVDNDAATSASAPELNLDSSQNATVNLVRLLVKQGVIPRDAAVELIRQAEAEARQARAQSAAVTAAAEQIKQAAAAEIEAADSDVRVTYVPEHVRQEIAADVRNEIAAKARAEGWGKSKNDESSWTSRLRPVVDLRARYNSTSFDDANDNTGDFPDFNSINNSSGGAINEAAFGTTPYPGLNADQNRSLSNIRLRAGFEADLKEGFSMGARLATGSGSSPVSTNQTIGSPGNFSKYSLWLDQAFLRWESGTDLLGYRLQAGRMPNPFFATELVWDQDIQFDGVSGSVSGEISRDFRFFATGGLFPIYSTSFNFPSFNSSGAGSAYANFPSDDRYLTAAQVGVEGDLARKIRVKGALAYYLFQDIEGKPSTPFVPLSARDAGDTDGRRPAFAQKGNTYMRLRDITPAVANGGGTTNQWQYYGLASEFNPLVGTLQVDFNHFEPRQITFYSEIVSNLAYDTRRHANHGSATDFGPLYFGGADEGNSFGYLLGVSVGDAALRERWDWRAGLDYRFLGSDAIVDGFADSDFGGGGTNLQGFTLYGRLALGARVFLGARWLSASEIEGAPFRSDTIQIDLNSKF